MDAGRLALLLRNDIVAQAKPILLTAGTACALMIVAWVINVVVGHAGNFYPFFFGWTIILGGLVLTSRSFTELHDPLKGTWYLTLPGSMPEKFISKLVLTSIGFAAATVLFFYAFSLAASLAARVIFGIPMPVFQLSPGGARESLVVFLTLHPLFFFGSIYFRRLSLLKTLFSVLSLLIAVGLVMTLLGWSLFSGINGAVALHNLAGNVSSFLQTHAEALELISRIIAWVVLPVFFIGLGYLRLTEYEVNNGL
jgi:hypothetical protein